LIAWTSWHTKYHKNSEWALKFWELINYLNSCYCILTVNLH
jgi:hypothetical protein